MKLIKKESGETGPRLSLEYAFTLCVSGPLILMIIGLSAYYALNKGLITEEQKDFLFVHNTLSEYYERSKPDWRERKLSEQNINDFLLKIDGKEIGSWNGLVSEIEKEHVVLLMLKNNRDKAIKIKVSPGDSSSSEIKRNLKVSMKDLKIGDKVTFSGRLSKEADVLGKSGFLSNEYYIENAIVGQVNGIAIGK